MARKLNWDRVGVDTKIRRHGTVPVTDGFPTPSASKKKRRQDRKKVHRASQNPRQEAAAHARAMAKKQKRLVEEQRVQEARAAKSARRAVHEANMAAARQKRRERLKAQAALEAQRKADPDYQAKQAERAAEAARRLTKRMKSVIVVRKKVSIRSSVRAAVSHGAKPSPSSDKQ
jgi:hypothetical protein